MILKAMKSKGRTQGETTWGALESRGEDSHPEKLPKKKKVVWNCQRPKAPVNQHTDDQAFVQWKKRRGDQRPGGRNSVY